jgi:hypothetical protein
MRRQRDAKTQDKSSSIDCAIAPSPKVGDIVAILTLTLAGEAFIEGRAVVRGRALGRHRYWVHFEADPVLRERTIQPGQHADPIPTLAKGDSRKPALTLTPPNHSDFFPSPKI